MQRQEALRKAHEKSEENRLKAIAAEQAKEEEQQRLAMEAQ